MFDLPGSFIAPSRVARLTFAAFYLSVLLPFAIAGLVLWNSGQPEIVAALLAVTVLLHGFLYAMMRRRDISEGKWRQAEGALQAEILERRRIGTDIEALNESLSDRVIEGTAALGAANNELRREIDLRGHAQESLQYSEQRLRGILESAMDGIVTVDHEQRIVLFNRAAEGIFGWTAAQAIGQRLDMLMPERFHAGHQEHIERFGATGTTSRRMGDATVIHGRRANGEEFQLEASISQLAVPEGKLFTVILRDVTERMKALEDLATFAAEANAVREQEKARVARELHDDLAQWLTALKMDTIWVRDNLPDDPSLVDAKLGGMLAMLDGSIAATRRIAADLRPLLLDDLGLAPAIEWLAQNFTQRTGVACQIHLDEDLELEEPYATAVFRIVQESLANVAKHAQAGEVHVFVVKSAREVTLRVQDNGRGFLATAPRKLNSVGLAGVRERVQMLKGKVRIESAPGAGTRIEARIPLADSGEKD